MAAHKQGKFWAYNDKVWAIADSLTPGRARADRQGRGPGRGQVARPTSSPRRSRPGCRRTGTRARRLGIASTPTIYINGREFTDNRATSTAFSDWINEELNR